MTPTLVALRERLGDILAGEVERSLNGRLRHLGAREREELLLMVDTALQRMLHPATTRCARLAAEPTSEANLKRADSALRALFGLTDSTGTGAA